MKKSMKREQLFFYWLNEYDNKATVRIGAKQSEPSYQLKESGEKKNCAPVWIRA